MTILYQYRQTLGCVLFCSFSYSEAARKRELSKFGSSLNNIDQDFACDGCWSSWERNLVDIDGDGKPDNLHSFKSRWVKANGAPEAIREQMDTTNKDKL